MEPLKDSVIYLELLDRDNHVIGHQSVGAGSFPVTIRLADGQGAPQASLSSAAMHGTATHVVSTPFWNRLVSPLGAVIVVSVTTICFITATYSHMFSRSSGTMLVGIMLFYLALFVLWAGGWALGGRIVRRQARFRDQFTWTCTCALASLAFFYVMRWEEFLFPDSEVFGVCFALIGVIITIVALYGHLSIASPKPPRGRWRTAVATVGVCVALAGLIVYAGSEQFDTSLIYNSSMQPLDARFIPSESVSDFTKDISTLKEKVDRSAGK